MEKCHLTYSYIFTPRVPHLLTEWGLDLVRAPDEDGALIYDLWLSSAHGPFCARFIEIIDERSLSAERPDNEFPLRPGFAQSRPSLPPGLSPRFALEGFLMEDPAFPNKASLISTLPAPVFFENRETPLLRQLGYKKLSPYWALLVRSSGPAELPKLSEPAIPATWRDHPVQWLQLETSCWDILIV